MLIILGQENYLAIVEQDASYMLWTVKHVEVEN
jgi:hypothetical protein